MHVLWLSLTNHIILDILLLRFFLYYTCQKSTLVCSIYISILLEREKVEIFLSSFLYVNLFFQQTYFILFFYLSLYILFAFTLESDLIYWSIDEKNSISCTSPCWFAPGSVNCCALLMMKLICYRFFLLLFLHLAIFIVVIRC
jgi:hypothetical protein